MLVGLGHTNADILRRIAESPLPGVDVVCITEHPEATYSGMLPASLTGQVPVKEMRIDLERLAGRAGAELIIDPACGLDPDSKTVQLASGRSIAFDVLSLGVGSRPSGLPRFSGSSPPSQTNVIPVKPMQTFHERFSTGLDSARSPSRDLTKHPVRIAIVGGGIAAIELACCLNQHLSENDVQHLVKIYTSSSKLGGDLSKRACRLIDQALVQRGIQVQTECRVAINDRGQPELPPSSASPASLQGGVFTRTPASRDGDGNENPLGVSTTMEEHDLFLWVTHAIAPGWFTDTKLAKDDRGFFLVEDTLQSVDHPDIFVVGDSATVRDQVSAKAGVYAVRQAPVLWHNLQVALEDVSVTMPVDPSARDGHSRNHVSRTQEEQSTNGKFTRFEAQKTFLKLINVGDGSAVLDYRGFAIRSKLAMWLKQWIDRRFVRQFQSSVRPLHDHLS